MSTFASRDVCSCGAEVTKIEVRVVQRCSRGHYVTSQVAPAVLAAPGHEPQTPGQQRAFHAKCGTVDRLRGLAAGTTKRETLAGFGVESSRDLDSAQMSTALDQLEQAVAAAQA